MAYTLKYQSNFYNRFGALVSVKIYKKDYSGSAISIRVSNVELQWGIEDFYTPIAGAGVSITIVNTFNEYDAFSDLLKSYPKDFKCVIEYNGNVVFEGFNVTELNEVNLLQYNSLIVKFTDQLKMLQYDKLTGMLSIGGQIGLFDLIEEALYNTGLTERDLYVNSTLFEANMADEASSGNPYCFLTHSYIEKSIFYDNLTEYKDTLSILNEVFKPFSAFIYSYGDKWILERYEDIDSNSDWVWFDLNESSSSSCLYINTLKQTLYKQNDDFNYIESSQKLSYKPAIQKLKLNLQERKLNSLVFNEFSSNPPHTSDIWPTSLTPRTWTVHSGSSSESAGTELNGITTYFKWTPSGSCYVGAFYNFMITLNDINGEKADNVLEINFKFTVSNPPIDYRKGFYNVDVVGLPVFLYANKPGIGGRYILLNDDGTITTSSSPCWLTGAVVGEEYEIDRADPPRVLSFEKTLLLQNHLGTGDIEMILGIHGPYWQTTSPVNAGYYNVAYIGDFSVTFDSDNYDNVVEATIDENFLNTEEIDLNLYDLPNWNFASGILRQWGSSFSEMAKSNTWGSDNFYTLGYTDLVDNFIYNTFRRNAESRLQLNARIDYDGYLKPFAILMDDNIKKEGESSIGDNVKMIVTEYIWDMVNGFYEVKAEEYPDTEISITSW